MQREDCWLQDQCRRAGHCPEEFCIKQFKIDQLSQKALLSEKQRQKVQLYLDADGADRESYQFLAQMEQDILSFVQAGYSIFISSPIPGNGKSSWALRLLNAYINRSWAAAQLECKALFVHVPRFFQALKHSLNEYDEYAEYVKTNITKADLVVFDEIANKSITTFEADNLLSIISQRIDLNKASIYTSNLCGEELRLTIGDRLYSRILNNSTVLTFVGRDKRGLVK